VTGRPASADGVVGIADSGVGGLTVVRAFRAAIPGEDLLYIGDTAGFPYGGREDEDIRRRVVGVARWLRGRGAKLVVLACNTASAVALDRVRADLDVPVVGVIDSEARAAARASRAGAIGLLATEATVRSGAYDSALGAIAPGLRLTSVACAGLAAAIQDRAAGDPVVSAMVGRFTAPLAAAGVDTVILGCTHYPAVAGLVGRALPGAALVAAGAAIADDVEVMLTRSGLRRPGVDPGTRRFACTADASAFATAGARILGEPLGRVELARP
jgi:glutamate racemase